MNLSEHTEPASVSEKRKALQGLAIARMLSKTDTTGELQLYGIFGSLGFIASPFLRSRLMSTTALLKPADDQHPAGCACGAHL